MSAWQVGAGAGIASAIVHLLGYGLYLLSVRRGLIQPNATSVALWVFGSAVSIWVYAQVTQDWFKLALPIACAAGLLATLSVGATRKSLVPLDRADIATAILDVGIIGVWFFSRDVGLTYAALIADTAVSFVPIVRSTLTLPSRERATPWLVWTFAYALMLLAAVLRWEGWLPVLLPAVCILCHLVVAVIAASPRLLTKAGRF